METFGVRVTLKKYDVPVLMTFQKAILNILLYILFHFLQVREKVRVRYGYGYVTLESRVRQKFPRFTVFNSN